jgi:hypothetical protein
MKGGGAGENKATVKRARFGADSLVRWGGVGGAFQCNQFLLSQRKKKKLELGIVYTLNYNSIYNSRRLKKNIFCIVDGNLYPF